MSDPLAPYFDRIELAAFGPALTFDAVTHRNASGEIFAFHSPLELGPVRCDLCESETRVAVKAD